MAKFAVNLPVIFNKGTLTSVMTTMCSFFQPTLSPANLDLIDYILLLDSWLTKKVIVFGLL